MRERERKSRSQIAQQAARDTFMEQASGAVFAEPIKVSRRVRGHRVTAGRGAPVIRRARCRMTLMLLCRCCSVDQESGGRQRDGPSMLG